MPEFRVKWCQCPHVQHTPQVLFVEADTADAARAFVKSHIERSFGIEWFSVQDVSEAKPIPPGRIVERQS